MRMTNDEFRAWLERHFPGQFGTTRAATYLGKSKRSVERMRDGAQPIMQPTARKCEELPHREAQ